MTVTWTRSPASTVPGGAFTGLGLCVAGGAVMAAGIAVLGPAFAAAPVALAAVAAAICFPSRFAVAWLAVAVAVDSSAVGFTSDLNVAVWQFPQPLVDALPLTVNPWETLLAVAAVSMAVRRRQTEAAGRFPLLVWCVPAIILSGLAWGMVHGGALNLAYHEARGLIFGALAFWLAWQQRAGLERRAAQAFVAAVTLLASLTIARYAIDLAPGRVDVPLEFWYSHETGLFLAIGCVVGCGMLLSARGDRERLRALAFTSLVVAAMLVTGRRSAILVAGAGAGMLLMFLVPKRPAATLATAALIAAAGALYLGLFWQDPVGPLGEPARAVRSQIDPDPRDESSDQYRKDERENLQRTLRVAPFLGVGFGRPFVQYIELPPLEFWPLQSYTPHQNILWLWLKTGLAGAAVLLGTWMLAMRNCIAAVRALPRRHALPVYPMVIGAALLMYLVYARVDLAFVGSRSTAPLAVLLALAFHLPSANQRAEWDTPL